MSDDRLDRLDYYSLLGVEPAVSSDELHAAFRRFARRYHPDRFSGQPPEKIDRATAIYRRGSEAFQVVADPAARALYDQALARGKLRLTADQRDGAERRLEQQAEERGPDLAIRSPAAGAFYRKALAAIACEDWTAARACLTAALAHEPDNFILDARLEQVDRQLRERRR